MMAAKGVAEVSYRVVILGSGSKGNSLLVAGPHARVLIDMGFSERRITCDLAAQGLAPTDLAALFVTHTHGDHVNLSALRFCLRHHIPLVMPNDNLAVLRERFGAAMGKLDRARLARAISPQGFHIAGLDVRPFELPHDAAGLTLGYHLTLGNGPTTAPLRVVVATDLGHVSPEALRIMATANVLVLESNHDPQMLRDSGRPQVLIDRILGPAGHLANEQTAAAIELILARQAPGELREIVLAHLSGECNEPCVALSAARKIVKPLGAAAPQVHVASQDEHLAVELTAATA